MNLAYDQNANLAIVSVKNVLIDSGIFMNTPFV